MQIKVVLNMENVPSIVIFENEKLQNYLKILSIDGKLRNQSSNRYLNENETPFTRTKYKFNFEVEALFDDVPLNFSIKHLSTDEFLDANLTILNPIVFSVNNVPTAAKLALYMTKNGPHVSNHLLGIVDSFDSGELESIIFDGIYSHFKKTNTFKLLNTFYK
jgi:hypothetical protein